MIHKHRDEQVKQIFEQVFPDKKIVQIEDVENVNCGGGGMHCISQQMPAI
jgi:agmatine deiminase